MRNVLLVSARFPPDSGAAAHRVRLLAPHLADYGWEPTVLTLQPDAYEGALDPELESLAPSPVRVVRASALPARLTRLVGLGDLGLRSFVGLYRAASRLLSRERFDALFITIFPAYTALLGPLLVRRFHIPFVLDYQDPWVSEWGATVGGGPDGGVDLKSRASRALAEWLEPHVVRAAGAITAVSAGTYEPILRRNPTLRPITDAIPIGAEPLDFRDRPDTDESPSIFDPRDGLLHVCYTGTILPLGFETLEAVLGAVRVMKGLRPDLYDRLRLHFIGTSNQTTQTDTMRVRPLAEALGVGDRVDEHPTRVPYSTAIRLMRRATVLLAMGSSEGHYTASKIYPQLLAGRPLLAVYHEASSVTTLLRRVVREPSVRFVTYTDSERAGTRVAAIAEQLVAILDRPLWTASDLDTRALSEFYAANIAKRFAGIFDRVAGDRAA